MLKDSNKQDGQLSAK